MKNVDIIGRAKKSSPNEFC